MKKLNNKTTRIFLFVIISLSTSVLFRYDIFNVYKNWNPNPIMNIYKTLIEALGPFIGGLLITSIFNVKRSITFKGNLNQKSLLMLAVPIIGFGIFGIQNSMMNKHIYGIIIGFWIVTYGILEETGWRGYLQDELSHLKPLMKYTVVGLIWYFWHLTFLRKTTLVNEVLIAFVLILSSIGIGYVTDKTKSIFVAACFHIIGNILAFSSLFSNVLPLNTRIILVSIFIMIWMVLLRKKTLPSASISS